MAKKYRRPKIAALKGPRTAEMAPEERYIRQLACFDEVVERLKEGEPTKKVVEFIRREGEGGGVEFEKLRRGVVKVRQSLPKTDVLQYYRHVAFQRVEDALEESFDVRAELASLYSLQKRRLLIGHKHEENFDFVNKELTQEVTVAQNLLMSLHKVQSDLGLTRRHLGELDVNTKSVSLSAHVSAGEADEEERAALEEIESDPKKINNVLELFQQVVRLSEESDNDDAPEGEEVIDVQPEIALVPSEPSSEPPG